MRVLRAADRRAVPWKNGGGVTSEVAAFPPGAGMEDFGWRVSIADVDAAGSFSTFGDVDRILTVLDGTLRLDFADTGRSTTLHPGEPFAFPGDVPVEGAPIGGPVRDLNVMVRRHLWRAEVFAGDGDPASGTAIAIFVASAPASIGPVMLQPLDAALLDPGERLPGHPEGYLIALQRLAG